MGELSESTKTTQGKNKIQVDVCSACVVAQQTNVYISNDNEKKLEILYNVSAKYL